MRVDTLYRVPRRYAPRNHKALGVFCRRNVSEQSRLGRSIVVSRVFKSGEEGLVSLHLHLPLQAATHCYKK